MTAFFVQKFKRDGAYKCFKCKKDKLTGYSLCTEHLKAARERWRTWAFDRRSLGRCISCDRQGRKATRGHYGRTMDDREQRCSVHARLNQKKCAAWLRRHPEYHAQAYERQKKIRDAGFCPKCPEHRKLLDGFMRCEPCRIRRNGRRSTEQQAAA